MFSDDCTEISQKISYICHMICWYWTMDSWNCYTSFHFIASFKVTHFMVETFNCFLGTWHSIYDMFFILIDNVKNLQIFFICCYEMIDDTNIIGNKFAGFCLCILSWIRVIRSFYTFAITCQDSERLNIMFFFPNWILHDHNFNYGMKWLSYEMVGVRPNVLSIRLGTLFIHFVWFHKLDPSVHSCHNPPVQNWISFSVAAFSKWKMKIK